MDILITLLICPCKAERNFRRQKNYEYEVAGAQAQRENAIAKHKATIVRNDQEKRSLTCQPEDPETWPFRLDKNDSASCWHHKAQICPFCCTDFVVINTLRQNRKYLALCHKEESTSERLRIVESTIHDYFERIKMVSKNPAMKHSPDMLILEGSLNPDDLFRRILLAAYHCFDARGTNPSTKLSHEIDSIVQAMETVVRREVQGTRT